MLYIGHTTLEIFMRQVTPEQPLYLNLLEEFLPGSKGIGLLRCYLLLQTTLLKEGQEASILYWRMRIDEILAPGGIPWENQYTAARKAGLSAQEAVRHFLDMQPSVGNVAEGAVLAMPRELKLVAGGTDSLTFDKASGTFRLVATAFGEDYLSQDQTQTALAKKTAGGSASWYGTAIKHRMLFPLLALS